MTRERLRARPGWMLILHDTTEFSCHRQDEAAVGLVSNLLERRVCGLLMHARLAMMPQGLPLGLGTIKLWTRQPFKGTNALKRPINPTRVPIEQKESVCWLENLRPSTQWFGEAERLIPIGDREGDIDERFCEASRLATHCLVRTGVDSAGR